MIINKIIRLVYILNLVNKEEEYTKYKKSY